MMTTAKKMWPLLVGLSLAIGVSPSKAMAGGEGGPLSVPYQRVELAFHRLPPPAEVLSLIENLKAAVRVRKLSAITKHVTKTFFRDRDFAGMVDPGRSGADNFKVVLHIDPVRTPKEYIDEGWAELGRILDYVDFGPAENREGHVCTPALPVFRDEKRAQKSFDALKSDFMFDWMYTEGVVPVHAAADAHSPVIARLEREAVFILDQTFDENDRLTYRKVLLPDGRSGHVVAGSLASFMDGRLCFARDRSGQWGISGYIGGKAI
jgi:hypothetical protein